jgi:hypothetical protein
MIQTMYNANKSILKGAANIMPISLARQHYSITDMSTLTDMKLLDEYQKLEKIKK